MDHDWRNCLLCYANGRKRANHPGHRGYKAPRKKRVLKSWEMRQMKRPDEKPKSDSELKPAKGDILLHCPLLWDMLTDTMWDDGKPRVPSTILLLCDGGSVKLWLNDRATDRTAWIAAECLERAFLALEEGLATCSVMWRQGEARRKGKGQY
jgi:hypothetical protein